MTLGSTDDHTAWLSTVGGCRLTTLDPVLSGTLAVTGDDAADGLLNRDPLALLIGMLLDQQVPMEWAFRGPSSLVARVGGLDARTIAEMGSEAVETVFCTKPALHRYPGAMGRRTHALCAHLVERYEGDPTRIWSDNADAATVLGRLKDLPGYGDEKAKIFLAILGKRTNVQPAGWREKAGVFGDDSPRSVADIDSEEALQRVRAWKKQQKAQGKTKAQ